MGGPRTHLDEPYWQEYYVNETADWGMVVATNVTVTVPTGTYTRCLQTEDWNALEDYHGSLERKLYCPGVGWVKEVEDPEEVPVLTAFETA